MPFPKRRPKNSCSQTAVGQREEVHDKILVPIYGNIEQAPAACQRWPHDSPEIRRAARTGCSIYRRNYRDVSSLVFPARGLCFRDRSSLFSSSPTNISCTVGTDDASQRRRLRAKRGYTVRLGWKRALQSAEGTEKQNPAEPQSTRSAGTRHGGELNGKPIEP